MAQPPVVPSYVEMLWPTLQAIRAIGGSGSIEEIVEKVVELEGFTEEQQSVLHGDGPRSQIEYRLAWSRTYLKGMGLLENSARGVWALTDKGRDPSLDENTVLKLHTAYAAQWRARLRARRKAERDREPHEVDEADQEDARDWKEEVLDAMLAMSPAGFERLAQRLLREAGFISATVMGRSGDGGIDGLGVYRCRWSASRSTSSASVTAAASGLVSCATSVVPWPGAVTRGCLSPRPGASPGTPSGKPPGTGLHLSTLSTGTACASCSRTTSWGWRRPFGRSRRSLCCQNSSQTCNRARQPAVPSKP
jgi:Mrr N-terminal domain/Restriction endonuclease